MGFACSHYQKHPYAFSSISLKTDYTWATPTKGGTYIMYGTRTRKPAMHHHKGGVKIEHHEIHRVEHHPAKKAAPNRRTRRMHHEY